MIVRAIIQARMSSTRLPGKSLMNMGGLTLINRVISKIRTFHFINEVVVATTYLPADDLLEIECKKLGVKIYRGDPLNVLSRYIEASSDLSEKDIILRFTADNPLYNLKISQKAFLKHKESNSEYSYIDGLSHVVPEIIQVSAIRYMSRVETTLYEQEHVTPFLRSNSEKIKLNKLPQNFEKLNSNLSKLLTIDTEEDYKRFVHLGKKYPLYKEEDIQVIYDWINESLI